MAEYFSSNSSLLHFRAKEIPAESVNYMTNIKGYHQRVRREFIIIQSEALDIDAESAIQMAVKAINDSIEPDELVPTLLVYDALPRLGLPRDQPTASTIARATEL